MKSQKHKPSFWEAQLLEMLATNTLPGKNVPTCVWQHPKLKKNQKWYQKQGGTKGWELRYGLSSIHPDKMNSWKQKVKIWKMMKMNFPFSIRWFWGSIIILSGSTMITMMIVSHDHANEDAPGDGNAENDNHPHTSAAQCFFPLRIKCLRVICRQGLLLLKQP